MQCSFPVSGPDAVMKLRSWQKYVDHPQNNEMSYLAGGRHAFKTRLVDKQKLFYMRSYEKTPMPLKVLIHVNWSTVWMEADYLDKELSSTFHVMKFSHYGKICCKCYSKSYTI